MFVLLWLLFGAIVGWMASVIMKTDHKMGLFANIIFGLIGSALGMWILDIVGLGNVNTFTFAGLLVSVGGAIIVIIVIRALTKK